MLGFSEPFRAAVIGASGGIGRDLCEHLIRAPGCESLVALSRTSTSWQDPKVATGTLDLRDEDSIARAAAEVGPCHAVICATGILHEGERLGPEKSFRHIDPAQMTELFAINSIGPALVAKHFLPSLPRHGRGLFAALSARVGSIGDNALGGWHSYRASKAALNMLIKNFAIETARRNPDLICAGLHPGTVDTGLSKPFQASIPDRQLFSSDHSARHLLTVLEGLQPADSGKCFAWDGQEVPY